VRIERTAMQGAKITLRIAVIRLRRSTSGAENNKPLRSFPGKGPQQRASELFPDPLEGLRPRLSLRHGPRRLEGGRRPHQVNTLQRLAENGVVDILRRPQDDPALPLVRWLCAGGNSKMKLGVLLRGMRIKSLRRSLPQIRLRRIAL